MLDKLHENGFRTLYIVQCATVANCKVVVMTAVQQRLSFVCIVLLLFDQAHCSDSGQASYSRLLVY